MNNPKIEKLDICKTYRVKNRTVFLNERTQEKQEFGHDEIRTQIEGQNEKDVVIRGKYPYDAFYTTTTIDNVEEV